MGAACPCMKAKTGVKLGGDEGNGGSRADIAAARAAKFEENKKKKDNRGLTKESAIEL